MRKGLVVLLLGCFVAAASAKDDPRVLRVRFGDGAPAAGTLVVPCREHDGLPSARCDAEGVVTLTDARTADRVVLFDPPAVPCVVPLATDATEIVVPLVRLAGRVLVDGAPPRQPLDLGLSPKLGDSLSRIGPIPGVGGPLLRALSTRTDASGAFDFGLVAATLSGTIDGPRTLQPIAQPTEPGNRRPIPRPIPGWRSVSFDRAAPDLVLEFHALPLLSGRVVDAEGRPLAGSRVEYEFTNEASSGSGGGSGGLPVDGDARFAVPLNSPPMRRAALHLIGPAGTGRRTLTLDPVPAEGRDLGDIALEPNEPLLVEARDTQGRPLQGAIVLTLDGRVRSEPTGADGRVVFRDRVAGDDAVQVVAFAHELVKVPARAAPGEPVVAVLKPLSSLDIEARLPDGALAPDVVLRFSAETAPFGPEPSWRQERMQEELGATPVSPATGGAGCGNARADMVKGHALLTGLRSGVVLQAWLTDRYGTALCDPETLSVPAGTTLRRTWAVAHAARPVKVLVRGPDGAPVVRARVSLGGYGSGPTGSDGRIDFHPAYGGSVEIEVSPADTNLGRTESLTVAVPEDGLIIVDLVPARTLVVEIVDELGVAVDGVPRLEGFGTVNRDALHPAPGHFEFEGLGAGDVDITVHLCDRAWTQHVDTAAGVARFGVPATGEVRIRLAGAVPAGETWYVNFKGPKGEWAGARPLPTTGLAEGSIVDLGAFLPNDYHAWLTRGVAPPNSSNASAVPVSVTPGNCTDVLLSP